MRFIFLHWIISKYFLFLFRCFRVIGLEVLSCTTHKLPTRGSCPQQVSFFPSLWFSEILLSIANSLVVRFLKNTEKRCGDRFSVQSFSIAVYANVLCYSKLQCTESSSRTNSTCCRNYHQIDSKSPSV